MGQEEPAQIHREVCKTEAEQRARSERREQAEEKPEISKQTVAEQESVKEKKATDEMSIAKHGLALRMGTKDGTEVARSQGKAVNSENQTVEEEGRQSSEMCARLKLSDHKVVELESKVRSAEEQAFKALEEVRMLEAKVRDFEKCMRPHIILETRTFLLKTSHHRGCT